MLALRVMECRRDSNGGGMTNFSCSFAGFPGDGAFKATAKVFCVHRQLPCSTACQPFNNCGTAFGSATCNVESIDSGCSSSTRGRSCELCRLEHEGRFRRKIAITTALLMDQFDNTRRDSA